MTSPFSKLVLGLALGLAAGSPLRATVEPAPAESLPSARPGTAASELRSPAAGPAPALAGEGAAAHASAAAFFSWASATGRGQANEVRQALAAARNNSAIATAFCQQAQDSAGQDLSRALLALALLGEMRSASSLPCLKGFLDRPLPEKGTVVDGEIQERKALEILQTKALAGLAYLRTSETDALVLQAVSSHPSRAVRAGAVIAYLWNHGSSAEARETLRKAVRQGDSVLIDRPIRSAGQDPAEYDRQLAAYLEAHPELEPPPPVREIPGTNR